MDNCSNCKNGRGRRAEIYCSIKQKLVSLQSHCLNYGKGEQMMIGVGNHLEYNPGTGEYEAICTYPKGDKVYVITQSFLDKFFRSKKNEMFV